jgi:hypothetical protein
MAAPAGGSAAASAAGGTGNSSGAGEKHPLHTGWSYWELRKKWISRQDWKDLPTTLFTVDTVEDFWACWSRVPKITYVDALHGTTGGVLRAVRVRVRACDVLWPRSGRCRASGSLWEWMCGSFACWRLQQTHGMPHVG